MFNIEGYLSKFLQKRKVSKSDKRKNILPNGNGCNEDFFRGWLFFQIPFFQNTLSFFKINFWNKTNILSKDGLFRLTDLSDLEAADLRIVTV